MIKKTEHLLKSVILILILMAISEGISLAADSENSDTRYTKQVNKIFEIREKIVDLHPYLATMFPVAVAKGDHVLIYDLNEDSTKYEFVYKAEMEMPERIRASFPIAEYYNHPCCIISPDVFEDELHYIVIFHEYMHCTQWITCEMDLKGEMQIYNEAMAREDYMWELNYPFPYEMLSFEKKYSAFMDALDFGEAKTIKRKREGLTGILKNSHYEYLVWQEWKEGFARWIENNIRERLGYEINHYGCSKPYNRITFYEGGAMYIDYLVRRNPALGTDIEALYHAMQGKSSLDE